MASTRFVCLMILLVLTVWHSIAIHHQEVKATALIIKGDHSDSKYCVDASCKMVRGRKMAMNEKSVSNEGGLGSKMVSNTKHVKNGGEKLHQEEVYGVGFVGLNSDYRAPRRHPPKNN